MDLKLKVEIIGTMLGFEVQYEEVPDGWTWITITKDKWRTQHRIRTKLCVEENVLHHVLPEMFVYHRDHAMFPNNHFNTSSRMRGDKQPTT